jgi:hypothetical protein
MKVAVLQADNRPDLEYLVLSQKVNKQACDIFDYQYLFLDLNYSDYGDIHPATKKIYAVNDTLTYTDYDVIVFLDSDAWIQNGNWLNDTIKSLMDEKDKHGCFSRDPYCKINTYINSGSFIIKNNNYIKNMYKNLIDAIKTDPVHCNDWPFDQYYISNYVFKNNKDFIVFVPDILNTPCGKVLRHNWHKNAKMLFDLITLISFMKDNRYVDKNKFIMTNYYDKEDFPNTEESSYEYIL